MRKFKLVLMIAMMDISVFAGDKTETSDTINGYSSISLINIVEKSKAAFSQAELVNIIDSLMEIEKVDAGYYSYINSRIQKHSCPLNNAPNEKDELFPGSEYYETWDNKNFHNAKDILAADTVVNIFILDSLHNKYVHPCPGIVTSSFGWREGAPHNGIDLDLNKGDKVYVAFDGMVRIALKNPGYGNVVIVRHFNGLETTYAHLRWVLKIHF